MVHGETDMTRRMARGMYDVKRFTTYRDRIPILQPAIRFKRICMRKTKLFGLHGHTLYPECIFFMRTFDRHMMAVGQCRSSTRMINMAMRY